MNIMKETHNQGLMFDYPDKTDGKRDQWIHVRQKIEKDVAYILNKKSGKWLLLIIL